MCTKSNPKQYSIIKFQPSNILLLHKTTKISYQYFEHISQQDPLYHITHQTLIRPIIYNNGLLYPTGKSTLEIQLQNRRRAFSILYFSEQEIINTFIPLLECLTFLHKHGVIHGSISPSNVLITDDEEIKLKDWLIDLQDNIYYFHKQKGSIQKEDDLAALGQIIIQAATLRKGSRVFLQKQLNLILQNLIDRYSKGFLFAIAVLLKRNKQRFQNVIHYFKNQQKYLGDIELNSLYESVRREKDKKNIAVLANQNVNVMVNTSSVKMPLILSLNQSPVKKSTPNNSLGNTLRRVKQDSENKKSHNDETKKKQIDKINKIIQRSNQFVSQLMARKNNEHILKKIAPKPNVSANMSLFSETHKKLLKDSPLLSSPNKKIRTISRKK